MLGLIVRQRSSECKIYLGGLSPFLVQLIPTRLLYLSIHNVWLLKFNWRFRWSSHCEAAQRLPERERETEREGRETELCSPPLVMRFHILQRHKICFLRCCFLFSFKLSNPTPPALKTKPVKRGSLESSCLFGAFIEEATNLFKWSQNAFAVVDVVFVVVVGLMCGRFDNYDSTKCKIKSA